MATLYERIGGYDAIAAAVDDLMPRLFSDPDIGMYWRGQCKDTKRRQRQLMVDYFAAACGGAVIYTGRDMDTVHDGLAVSERDWDIFVRHVIVMMNDLNIRGMEREEFLTAIGSVKAAVVGHGKPAFDWNAAMARNPMMTSMPSMSSEMTMQP